MNPKGIELHPGHWKNTGSGANGLINEVTEARKVTKRVYGILRAHKVPATYFEDNTSSNQQQNLNALVKHHNQDRDDLIVSVHFNATAGVVEGNIGTEVLYYSEQSLAAKIAKAISDASGLKNRGAKRRTNLAVLTQTYEPAVCTSSTSTVPKEEETKLYQPSAQAITNSTRVVLNRLVAKDPGGIDPSWIKKLDEGKLTESDALGLIFVAIERGLIQGQKE
ncbi:hypothetical protein BTO30_12515 [Domibacillus antri]|uniref:MurNAc-LAA domain-containing protein n=1 Tax=Domibacillus antri TaxID=1714264 RepID=A0A1Q8Q3J7_9BACI|nr:N-acetylmuramoyl-L-alanine amidase [Domibacillus antri]OLN21914.1 hypothetical protein BTO30_12515 [Domibacillus antri]